MPAAERQPLARPKAPNEVRSMGFMFDHTAEGRIVKCLTVVGDAAHEAVVIEVGQVTSDMGVTRVLDRLVLSRDLP